MSGTYKNSKKVASLENSELGKLDGVTAGTVTASKAVVVDANKDISSFRNVTVTNLDAGASGTQGSVDVFPAVASKGKLSITCADQAGDTTVNLQANNMGQATVVNIPDPGASACFLVESTLAVSRLSADELSTLPAASTITLGAAGAATQTATIQLKDAAGTNVATARKIEVYMATDAAGAKSSAGAATSVTVSTGQELKVNTAKLHWDIVTDATGVAVLTFNNTGGGGAYTDRVALIQSHNGELIVSSALNVGTT
jgi:hypothetical protein